MIPVRMRLWWIMVVIAACTLGHSIEALGQMGNRMLAFNTLRDLFKGDIWESIDQEEVGRHLYIYPGNYQVIGLGTTDQCYRMGEVMVHGRVGEPSFLWANPEYPYRVSALKEAKFPWLQVALFDPKKELRLAIDGSDDLHGALIKRLQKDRVRMCAVYGEAVTLRVDYSLTYHIPKSGLDLSVKKGEAAYLRAFQDAAHGRWVFFGIYVDEDSLESCGMAPGQPLLLAGYNKDTDQGGLIRSAKVQSARISYYPLDEFEVLQSDLTVSDIRVHEQRITAEVKNLGDMWANHVKVRMRLPDSNRQWEAVIPALGPQEERPLRFIFNRMPSEKSVVVQVDPEDQIYESDEENNRMERKRTMLGW
jgi:hypothetical protein